MPLVALSPDAINWLIAVWLFVVGGAVGSFLNVVIYRLPAGMSLVRPGSHCPVCKHPIRWFDNLPVLGWLILRGRCRDCRARISARYPTVEAITATLFLVLGTVECLTGGVNLPLRATFVGQEVLGCEWTFAELCGTCAYHLLLLCTLLVAAMIELDGHRLPARLVVPAVIVGLAAPLAWPRLHPVPACGILLDGWTAGLVDGTAGLTAGLLLGWLVSALCQSKQKTGMVLGPACVGLFLGWQAAIVLTLLSAAIHLSMSALVRLVPGIRRLPPTFWLALVTLGWILAWGPLVRLTNVL